MSEKPAIDYSAKDYAGMRRLLLDTKKELLPEWTSESPNDFGIVLIELFCYLGDILSFYGDRIATEAFLSTAVNRASVVEHARVLDYHATGTQAATVDLEFVTTSEVTLPAGTQVSTRLSPSVATDHDLPVYFETDEEATVNGTALVTATEGQTVTEEANESTGRLDQSRRLDQFPVIHRSVRIFVDEGIGEIEWTYFDRLIEAGSTRNAFTTFEGNDGDITVVFGDDVNGRVPVRGASIRAEYRVGAGERGNVGPGTVTELHSNDSALLGAVDTVTNPQAASGGSDQESPNSIRRNAPSGLRALYRAVTLEDYANLAVTIPGIAKARARQAAFNTVALYVAPYGAGSTITTGKHDEVVEFFDQRKLTNVTLFVQDPTYVDINITVEVEVLPEYHRGQVESDALREVLNLLDFEEVDFAHFLPLSRVYESVSRVEGVSYANVTVLDQGAGTGQGNVQLDDFEIPVTGNVTIDASGGIAGT